MRFSAVFCFLLCLFSTVFAESVVEDKEFALVVTQDNFKQSILEADKDVFIKFYAPWCGHCKNLAPTYEKLAEKLSDEDLIIAKFDANAHEVPSLFDVRGYPTLFWLPKNAKDSPIVYRGGRSVDDFVKFIAKHSTDGLKHFDRSGTINFEEVLFVNDDLSIKEELAAKEESAVNEELVVDESEEKSKKAQLTLDVPETVKEVDEL